MGNGRALDTPSPLRFPPTMPDTTAIEERVAHLIRALDDLSDVVARQDRDLSRLQAQVAALLEREAARDAADPDQAPGAGRPPPHW